MTEELDGGKICWFYWLELLSFKSDYQAIELHAEELILTFKSGLLINTNNILFLQIPQIPIQMKLIVLHWT